LWALAWCVGIALGCGGGEAADGDDGDSGAAGSGFEGPEYELTGTWEFGSAGFAIRFEGDRAQLLSFGGKLVSGRQHFDVGDDYLRAIERIDNSTWMAEIARFDRVASPGEGSTYLHIVGVSYVPTMLRQSSLFLSLEIDNGLGTRLTKGSRTELEYGGACESRFQNLQDQTLYVCTDMADSDCASLPGTPKFWVNTTCRQLGYSYEYESGSFQFDSGNNGKPGAHGMWGDGSGGSGQGFEDGSGSTPPSDAVPVREGTDMPGAAGSGASTGGSGGSSNGCLVGSWKTPSCAGAKQITLSFNGSATTGSGSFRNPECNGQCDDIVFPYTYSVSGTMLTLDYAATAPNVACPGLGIASQPVKPPSAPDVMSFTCNGNTLTTTTSRGMATYQRAN
jgi:hypothetical protein